MDERDDDSRIFDGADEQSAREEFLATMTDNQPAPEHEHDYVTACFYCGHIVADLSSVPPTTVDARAAAEEIADQTLDILRQAYPDIRWPRGTISGIAFDSISSHLAAAPVVGEGEAMKSACVEKVREMRTAYADYFTDDDADPGKRQVAQLKYVACEEILVELESITLVAEKEK